MINKGLGILIGGMLVFSACFDPKESCLDIAATNFNADADKNCCCKYPKLQLTVDQSYGTEIYRQDSLYVGNGGHLFRIKNIVWYLSDFELFKDAEQFVMGDSLEFNVLDAANNDTITQTFIDDFTLIRRTPLVNEVASFREDGIFEKIKFRFGLSQESGHIIPGLAPSGHPLSVQTEELFNDEFVFLQVVVVRDSMAATSPDTLNFYRSDIGDFFIEGSGQFEHKIGYNFPIKLIADWQALFEEVDWTNDDPQAWKSQIVANLPSVFSVSQ